jgi:hypothetical protein
MMRKWSWVAGLGLALAWGGAARAQQALTFGPVVGPLQFKVANTDPSKLPIGGTFQRQTSFSLTDLFHTPTPFAAKPIPGHTVFPLQGQLPGMSYLKAFQFTHAQPAQ